MLGLIIPPPLVSYMALSFECSTNRRVLRSRELFELFFLAKNQGLTNGPEWQIDTRNTVGLPGAHGDELVRSFCFFDDAELVFTAGEDGTVKAWRPTS